MRIHLINERMISWTGKKIDKITNSHHEVLERKNEKREPTERAVIRYISSRAGSENLIKDVELFRSIIHFN